MVKAVLRALPKGWRGVVLMDWSDGFWDKMKMKYRNLVTTQVDRLQAEDCQEKTGIRRILKPCLVREATVSPPKCGNRALLTPLSLQSKPLQADYVSSHKE